MDHSHPERVLSGERTWWIGHQRAEELLASLPSECVDLVLVDPPYFRVLPQSWDRQWKTPGGYLAWLGEMCAQWHRVLRPNGSLYVFAGPYMAAQVEMAVAERFQVLNHIVWRKEAGRHKGTHVPAQRRYFPQSERLIFAEQRAADRNHNSQAAGLAADVFAPLREWLLGEFKMLGWTEADVNRIIGTRAMGRHYMQRSQWQLPSRRHYELLQAAAREQGRLDRDHGGLSAEWRALEQTYAELKMQYASLKRPFHAVRERPYTDVWDFPVVPYRAGKHPAAKPVQMLQHIIETSSRSGDLVLDCFIGSGATAEAALSLGRRIIGCDMEERWARVAADRAVKHADA